MGARSLGGPMRHPSAATREVESPPEASSAGDRATSEARAWLKDRRRWERRLAELRTHAEGAKGAPKTLMDPGADAGAER